MGVNQPPVPKKGMSKMLLVGIVVAIVAIAAIAGAYVLMSNNDGTNGTNGDDNNDDNDNQLPYQISNGQYMVTETTSDFGMFSYNSTTRWTVSNVTTTGYDVSLSMYNSMTDNTTVYTWHSDYNSTIGVGGEVEPDYGTKVGTESLATEFGTKRVDHYRNTTIEGDVTTVIDYYIGASTPVYYKMVMTITDSENPDFSGTTTSEVTDTNIDAVKNGNAA